MKCDHITIIVSSSLSLYYHRIIIIVSSSYQHHYHRIVIIIIIILSSLYHHHRISIIITVLSPLSSYHHHSISIIVLSSSSQYYHHHHHSIIIIIIVSSSSQYYHHQCILRSNLCNEGHKLHIRNTKSYFPESFMLNRALRITSVDTPHPQVPQRQLCGTQDEGQPQLLPPTLMSYLCIRVPKAQTLPTLCTILVTKIRMNKVFVKTKKS